MVSQKQIPGRTFRKGIHPNPNKITACKKIESGPIPEKVIIPLQQHIGAPNDPLVNKGDQVKKYQKLAETQIPVSAPVHSPVSGEVIDICDHDGPMGTKVKSIIIKNNMQETAAEIISCNNPLDKPKEELIGLIREAGIVGMGGATFPTHIKLKPQKPIDILLINGSECEPYLTTDHRIMLENSTEILKGIEIEMFILGAKKAIIGIEANKMDAVSTLSSEAKKLGLNGISVVALKTQYPQGAEKMLMKALLNRELPHTKLPMEAGVVVSNVATAKAIHDAIYLGIPLVERVVTITGKVKEPKNLLVRIGTPVKNLVEACGGFLEVPDKIVLGGPMMGFAQFSLDVPITKGNNGILAMSKSDVGEPMHCVRCSRCINACPYNLMPAMIAKASRKGMWGLAEKYHALECMECGCCTYVCPSKIPLIQHIKVAKAEIMKIKKAERQKEEKK